MSVKVVFFASLRDKVGVRELSLTASSLDHLLHLLEDQLPAEAYAALVEPNVRVAVNQELVEGNQTLFEGDEVAFLPPVTGG